MRPFVLGVIVFGLALAGCGGSDEGDTTTGGAVEARQGWPPPKIVPTAALEAKLRQPVPKAPPHDGRLTKLVIRNIDEGKGPAAQWGDEVNVRYVARMYQTGKIYNLHWEGVGTFLFNLDGKSFGVGWQRGIEGMRVGGRREILVPRRLLFKDADVAYMVTMLKVMKLRR